MRQIAFAVFLLIFATATMAGDPLYTVRDSATIEKILEKYSNKNIFDGELILSIAREFIGTPYVAGTLERCNDEKITINTRELDCTTFVEQVLAAAVTCSEEAPCFRRFVKNLERIRYRNGKCDGYASRLHYISQWIADSAKGGIITEFTGDAHTAVQNLNMKFMSTHPDSYRQLQRNQRLVSEIERHEGPFRGVQIKYIPKKLLNGKKEFLGINDGDIIALVTNIDGLDVSHIGIAFWEGGRLHLLHASSSEGCVTADKQTLYDYQKNKKSHLGIRVFKIKRR